MQHVSPATLFIYGMTTPVLSACGLGTFAQNPTLGDYPGNYRYVPRSMASHPHPMARSPCMLSGGKSAIIILFARRPVTPSVRQWSSRPFVEYAFVRIDNLFRLLQNARYCVG